jgi:hypothetical protein
MTDMTGTPYATIQELKTRYKISDSEDDVLLTRALKVATAHIEDNVCKRQFNDTGSATARAFDPTNERTLFTHDFSTSTGFVLKTDDDDDGVFETTWTSADYELRPVNGYRNGKTGWPFLRVEAVGNRRFPNIRRAACQVTAQWGWAAIPWEVKEATLILSEELWKLKDAPFGIAGSGEFGAVRVRENPKVAAMLKEFKRKGVLVA